MAFTTYKRNGEPKSVPVWIVSLSDGKVGFTTSSSSYKVKRLRNDNRVSLTPSDSKGKVKDGATAITGTAEAHMGAEFEAVAAIVKKKYGMQYRMITMVGKAAKLIGKGSGTDTAIIINLD